MKQVSEPIDAPAGWTVDQVLDAAAEAQGDWEIHPKYFMNLGGLFQVY